jgi:hypothetical protein
MGWNQMGRARARWSIATTAALVVLVLAGCTPEVEETPPPAPSASATPTETAAPAPVLDPAGDATANLAYFDMVNRALLATTPLPSGQQSIENLVAAGFAKADMEVSSDTTLDGDAADAIQFSVRINGSCLVGQTGNSGYNAIAAPLLGTGKCLIGKTRTIDF